MTTVPISQRTLTVGTHEFGPAAVPNGAAFVDISIDRTVSGGLNSLTGTSQLTLDVFESLDGGTTWIMAGEALCIGGSFTMHGGLPVNSNDIGVMIYPGATHAKASVTVAGTSITVAGTLTIQ